MKKVIIVVSLIWSIIVFAVIAATIQEYNVTFILPNEEVENVVRYNKSIKEPDFDSDSFEITGWYTNEELTLKYNFNKRVRSNVTLYPKVVYSNTFEVYFDSFEVETSKSVQVKEGSLISQAYSPDKEHYVFEGWYLDEDLTTGIDFSSYVVRSDVRLFAKFSMKTYQVTFLNELNEVLKTETVNSGESAIPPELDSKVGHHFVGWDKEFVNVTNNVISKAVYEKSSFTNHLVFNNNTPDETRVLNYGEPLNLSLKTPTLTGHSFVGWYESESLVDEFLELTMPDNDLTLYAKFNPNQYTLTFNPNNGLAKTDVSINFNDKIVIPISNPIKDHYEFVGWYLNDVLINEADLYTFDRNITLDAKYDKVDYQIDYTSTHIGFSNSNDKTYQIAEDNPLKPATLLGHSFTGWYLNNALVTNTNQLMGNVVLEARFEVAKYNVHFLDYDNTILKVEEVEYGHDATKPVNPTRLGYNFVDWDLDFTNVTSHLNVGPIYEKLTYNITYTSDSLGSLNPNLKTTYQVDDLYELIDGSLLGHSFTGWFIDDVRVTNLNNLIGNITLEARFTLDTFKVTFLNHLNETIEIQTIVGGESATAPTLNDRTGYTFIGWDKPFSNVTADLLVKALYEKTNYTNHLVFNNGTSNETRLLNYGDVLNLSQKEPSLLGHKFSGWYIDTNFTTIFNDLLMPANDLTLYAKFVANSYQISFVTNSDQNFSSKTINFNETINLADVTPSKEHHTFTGWYLADVHIMSGNTYTYLNNIVLEARYEKVNYQVTYSSAVLGFNNLNTKTNYQIDEDYELLPASLLGYEFLGWYIGEVRVTNLNQVSNNINLEAKFSINTYQINYHLPSGVSNPVGQITSFTKTTNNSPLNLNRLGYDFVGWYTDSNLEEEFSQFSNYHNNLNLYPKFDLINYTITYNFAFDEENDPNNLQTYTIETEFVFLPATKPYHTFNHFVSEGQVYNKISLGTTGNIELSPNFTTSAYIITYETSGKPLNNSLNPTVFISEETRIINAPDEIAFEFLGWYLVPNPVPEDLNNPDAEFDIAITSTENFEGNTTLYASWGAEIEFSLNYVTNYLSNSVEPLEAKSYHYDELLDVPVLSQHADDIVAGDRKKDFVGWFLDEALTIPFNQTRMGTDDITIYAKWTYRYIIYFNTDVDGLLINNLIVKAGDPIVNLKPANPSRVGYSFGGWYLSNEFENEFSFTIMPEEDVHLYAKWDPVKFTITYVTNIDSVANIIDRNANNDEVAPYNESVSNLVNRPKTLVGWYIDSSLTNLIDLNTHIINSDTTFYAKWADPVNLPDITVDYQNGTPDGKPSFNWYENYDINSIVAPLKDGYTFQYFEVFGSNGESLGNPESISILDDYTLVAIYQPNPLTLTIYIDGVLEPKVINTFYGEYLDDVLSLSGNIIEKEGFTIRNFYTDSNYQVVFNRSLVLEKDETLYANFNENTYVVTVETAPGVRFQNLYVSHNSLIALPKSPIRSGYELEHWTYNDQIIDLDTFEVTSDLTIIAVWKKVLYQVILIDNELNTETANNYSVGDLIEKPEHKANLPNGKIFAGWYTDLEFEVVYVHERYMEANILRLYARYIERVDVEYYQVENGVSTLLSYDIKNADNKLNEPQFERYGYITSGWYTDINLTNEYSFDTLVSTVPIKLYTVWEPRELELTLVVEGLEDETMIRYYNNNLNISDPSLVGHTFSHWLDENDNIFTDTLMPNRNLTLRAVFEVNNYLLQLNGNSGTIKYTTFEEDEFGNQVAVLNEVESMVLTVPFGTDLKTYLKDYRIIKYAYLFNNWVESGSSYNLTTMPDKNMILNASYNLHFTMGLIFEEGVSDGVEVWRITGYQGSSKNILTPDVLYNEDGTERPVIAITDNAFKLSKDIESIIIGDNIELIGNNAFMGLNKLTSVIISEQSKLKEIGVEAFKGATSLRTFDFPDSLITIRDSAFMNTKITQVTMGSNLIEIGSYAFNNTMVVSVNDHNSKLATIGQYAFSRTPLSSFEMPETIKTIANQAFSYSQLKSFILPDGIESIGTQVLLGNAVIEEMRIPNNHRVIYYFGNNNAPTSLKEITVFDKGSQSIIEYFASGTSGLLSVELDETIETINQYAFNNVKNLNTINLGNVKYIGAYAFRDNKSLRNIDLTNIIEIGDYAFYYATNLTSVYGEEQDALINLTTLGAHSLRATNLTSLSLPNVITVGTYALYDVNSLVELHFSNKLTTVGSVVLRANRLQVLTAPGAITLGTLFGSYNNMPVTLKTVHVAKGSLAIVARFAYYARYVRNYTIPSSVETIGTEAFRANYELTSIDLSETSITIIPAHSFYGTSLMRNIELPKTVVDIQTYAFYNSALSEIELPANLQTIGNYAFYGSKLSRVMLPEGLISLGNYAFSNISTVSEVYIPSSVTSIGSYVFRNSTNIRKATVPGNRSISQYAISNNINLTEVNITPGTVSVMNSFLENYIHVKIVTIPSSVVSIGTKAFSKMNSLETVDLSQTKITSIETSTFENTQALKQVLLPNILTDIGNRAFYSSNLTSLNIPNSVTTIGNLAFMNSNIEHLEIPIAVNTIGSRAFESMTRLKTLIINNPTTTFVTYSTESHRRLLTNSVNLEYLQIPSSIRLYYYGVDTVNNLQTLVITPGSTSVIADFANANSSSKLKSIKEVVLPDSLKTINGSAFRDLTITEIYLPEGLETILTSAFYNSSIERITTNRDEINNQLPSTLTQIGTSAFSGSSIREIHFISGVTLENNIFNNASLLETIVFHNDIVFSSGNTGTLTNATALRNLTVNGSVKTLSQIGIPSTLAYLNLTLTEGSQSVVAGFASGYTSVVSLDLPESLQQINANSFSNTRITNVVVPKNILSIGNNAFASNPAMTDFHLTNGNVTLGTTILAGNSALAHISVSGHLRLNQYDVNMANYSSLVSINIASGSNHIVSEFAKDFNGVSEVVLPSSVKTIYANAFKNSALHAINLEDVTQIQASAFEGTQLTTLTLSNNVISIGNRAFANTLNLTRVNVPASYRGGGNQMFAGSTNISKLTIPSHQLLASFGITPATNPLLSTIHISEGSEIIISSFLEDFMQVRTVVIPETVLEIGANAFKGTSIEKLTIPANVRLIQAGAFDVSSLEWIEFLQVNPSNLDISTNTFNANLMKIYIPKDSKALYEVVIPENISLLLEERVV